MRKEECYFLGRITRRHGLSGNVILKMDTDQPEFYSKMESMFIEINGLLVPFFVDKLSWSKGDSLNILFKNSNEALVDQVIGKEVYQPLSSLPKLSGKQFYYHEIVGYEIKDTEGKSYGLIRSVNDQTAQHYFILVLNDKEVVVPIIKDWIIALDREEKIMTMQLPEGLLDVFTTSSKKDE
ncbi:ribosome maturation factor RimM [Elizabethkingia miricola]|uniref:Ribosome maturation factor RimM n=1 Tax=Elizabethkingia miricola TaxID=172045 RepID=A0ABD5BBN5_ELIMR|nr:ribosome maturation factor RimM [Elizabethkingia miricola]MDQ8750907.1 ribosome maturation factor RimM [Elizabethkingia miricola]OPB86794.1 16S rRNA processing protein RimM [Elizabethkingia miricola]